MTGTSDDDVYIPNSSQGDLHKSWKQDVEQSSSQVESVQGNSLEVKTSIESSQHIGKEELESLSKRVKTASLLFHYLRSKAKAITTPDSSPSSSGVHLDKELELVDRDDISLANWSTTVDVSCLDTSDKETWTLLCNNQEEAYVGDLLKSVQIVSDVMEGLVKRVIVAELEKENETKKVILIQEEIRDKANQLECMYLRLEEMEQFTQGTNSILNEMRQRVEDLIEETSRQRQRAADNEEELCRVKVDFESLKSYVSRLISVRETLHSSEKQFQTIDKLFERLIAKTTQLESDKLQKEVEARKLAQENDQLTVLLDKKEAQLLALKEQFKAMALSTLGSPNMK